MHGQRRSPQLEQMSTATTNSAGRLALARLLQGIGDPICPNAMAVLWVGGGGYLSMCQIDRQPHFAVLFSVRSRST